MTDSPAYDPTADSLACYDLWMGCQRADLEAGRRLTNAERLAWVDGRGEGTKIPPVPLLSSTTLGYSVAERGSVSPDYRAPDRTLRKAGEQL